MLDIEPKSKDIKILRGDKKRKYNALVDSFEHRLWAPNVSVCAGATSAQSSRKICDLFSSDMIYHKHPHNKWWDGYCNQPVVIVDGFDGVLSASYWNIILDRHDCNGEVRRSSVILNSIRLVHFTSNKACVRSWWSPQKRKHDNIDGFLRRITHVVDVQTDKIYQFKDCLGDFPDYRGDAVERESLTHLSKNEQSKEPQLELLTSLLEVSMNEPSKKRKLKHKQNFAYNK